MVSRMLRSAPAALLLLAAPVAAQAPPRPPPAHTAVPPVAAARRLTFREAAQLGAAQGREVAVARAPRSAAADVRRAADHVLTTLPRATLTAGARRTVTGTGLEIGVTVLQDIPLGGVGGARRGVAEALGRVVEADVDRARLDAAARAANGWINLAEADRVLGLRQRSLDHAAGVARTVAARVTSGVAEPLELALARGDEATARASVLDAEGLRFEASMELAFALGLPAGSAVEPAGTLADIPDVTLDEAELTRRAERDHPLVKLAEARRGAAQRDADLSAAAGIPALGVGAAYVREGGGDQVWTGILSVPLPLSRTWAFDAARQRAVADTAGAHIALARAELGREIRTALHEREHTREVHDALATGALPPMREALRLSEAQLAAGTLDVTRVLLARQRLLAAEELVARGLADVRRADVRLLRASTLLLQPDAAPPPPPAPKPIEVSP
jgi:cobalt-zinc-cadmium efflux system outer membrane protein